MFPSNPPGRRWGLPISHCCAVVTQSPHTLLKGRIHACACGQKTTLRAPRWRPSRASAPHKKTRPAAQRSGGHRGVATRKVTGDLATHGGAGDPASEKEQCVGTCDRGLEKARRTGAVELLRYAACYGLWLLSKARPPPSPPGLHVSCWASVPTSSLLLELSRSLTWHVGRKSPR